MLAEKYRDVWLNHILALGDLVERPGTGEVFESDLHCRERLDTWGFAASYRFVTTKNRLKNRYLS